MNQIPRMTIDAVMDEIAYRKQKGLMEKPYPTRKDVAAMLGSYEPEQAYYDAFDSARDEIISLACARRMNRGKA